MNRRLRISGILILAGLLIELFSFAWSHPLSFLVFVLVGGLLMTVGILFYLYSLTIEPRLSKNSDKLNEPA
jgi:hypothetical protein